MRCPRKSNGYIDYQLILEIVVGELNLPYSYLDDMTYAELFTVINARRKAEHDNYKMMSYAVQGAMYAIHTGKKNPLLEVVSENGENEESTKEEREQEVNTLNEMFS